MKSRNYCLCYKNRVAQIWCCFLHINNHIISYHIIQLIISYVKMPKSTIFNELLPHSTMVMNLVSRDSITGFGPRTFHVILFTRQLEVTCVNTCCLNAIKTFFFLFQKSRYIGMSKSVCVHGCVSEVDIYKISTLFSLVPHT